MVARARKRSKRATPAQARARRENGKAGGRPTAKLPKQLLAEIGEPPEDVLKQDAWWSRLITVQALGVAKGEPWKSMLELTCKAAAVAQRMRVSEIKALVAEMLEREERENKAEASPPVIDRGKDPIAAAQRGALRRNPS